MGWIDRLFRGGAKSDPTFPLYSQLLGVGQPVYTPRDYKNVAQQSYEKNVTCYRAVALIAQSCAGIPWKLYKKADKQREIEDHPLLTLLEQPNPEQALAEFIEEAISFWILAGNSYVVAVRPANRAAPSELWNVRPDRIRILPGLKAVAGYEYSVDTRKLQFDARDILHLKMFAATNDYYGLSPLLVAMDLIDQTNEGNDWNVSLLQNAGRPSGALVAAGTLGVDQFDRLRKVIRERYIGKMNAGLPLLLEGGLDWKPFSLTPLELDWLESRKQNMRDISIALGVPPELLGDSSNKTYSNYGEARKSFYQETILPLMDRLRDRLNTWLVAQFDETLYLDYDAEQIEALQENRDSLSTRVLAQWNSGILTLNETRKAMGQDELPGGDILQLKNVGVDYIPLEQLEKITEKKTDAILNPPPPPGTEPPVAEGEAQEPTEDDSDQEPEAQPAASGGNKNMVKTFEQSLLEEGQHLVAARFRAEAVLVEKAAKEALLPETVLPRVERILIAGRKDWNSLYAKLYKMVGQTYGEKVYRDLVTSRKTLDHFAFWSAGTKAYVEQRAGTMIAKIEANTLEELRDAINYGIAKKESVTQIASRLRDVYSQMNQGRSEMIAATETHAAMSFGAHTAAIASGVATHKTWRTQKDGHVRPAHKQAEEQEVGLYDPFIIEGEKLMFPGDTSLGASGDNTIRCRCLVTYKKATPVKKKESPEEVLSRVDSMLAGLGIKTGSAAYLLTKHTPEPQASLLPVEDTKEENLPQEPVFEPLVEVSEPECKQEPNALAEPNTGAMIALLLDQETAQQLALPDGEPVGELHITLAYLGKAANLSDDLIHVLSGKLQAITQQQAPLEGMTVGLEHFPEGQDGVPYYVSVDLPGVAELHKAIDEALRECGGPTWTYQEYTPHITLKYVQPGQEAPSVEIPSLPLHFTGCSLILGNTTQEFPFGRKSLEGPAEEKSIGRRAYRAFLAQLGGRHA